MSHDWFRSWHGAPTDPKWRTVAKRAGVRPGDVAAVVWVLLDRASQAKERGSIEGYDAEVIADALGYDPEHIIGVVSALHDKGVLVKNIFTNWEFRSEGSRPSVSGWAVIREAIFARDDFTCAYCGRRGGRLECDHIIPVSRGGGHEDSNLTTACFACNRSKRDKLVSEWRPQ